MSNIDCFFKGGLLKTDNELKKLCNKFIFSFNNSISFNSLAIEDEEDAEFSDGLNGSIFIGVLFYWIFNWRRRTI